MLPNEISAIIVDAGIKGDSTVSSELLEEAYKVCLKHELTRINLSVISEIGMPVAYHGVQLDLAYRIDLSVESSVVVELKSVYELLPVHKAQLLTELTLSNISLGLLINFNEALRKDGIVRMANT